jgi:hypothetical protein
MVAAYAFADGEWWEALATPVELAAVARYAAARERIARVAWPALAAALRKLPADLIAAACGISKVRAVHLRHGHTLLTRDERDRLVRRRLVKAEQLRGLVKGVSP